MRYFLILIATALLLSCNSESSSTPTPTPMTIEVNLLGPAEYILYKMSAEGAWVEVSKSKADFKGEVAEPAEYALVAEYDPSQLPAENAIPFLNEVIINGCNGGAVVIEGQNGCKVSIDQATSGNLSIFVKSPMFSDKANSSGKFDPVDGGGWEANKRSEKYKFNPAEVPKCDNQYTANYFVVYQWESGVYADLADYGVKSGYGGTQAPIQFAEGGMKTTDLYKLPKYSIIRNVQICAMFPAYDGLPERCTWNYSTMVNSTMTILRMNDFNLYSYDNPPLGCPLATSWHDPYGDQRPVEISK